MTLFCKKAPESLYLACRAVNDSPVILNTFQDAEGYYAPYTAFLSDTLYLTGKVRVLN